MGITLAQLNRMRDYDRYFYKDFIIESYLEYDQDTCFKEYSVEHNKKLYTFISTKEIINFIESHGG